VLLPGRVARVAWFEGLAPGVVVPLAVVEPNEEAPSVMRMGVPLCDRLPFQAIQQRRGRATGEAETGGEVALALIAVNRKVAERLRLRHPQARDLGNRLAIVLPGQDHGAEVANCLVEQSLVGDRDTPEASAAVEVGTS
jgi:hypothetical protein